MACTGVIANNTAMDAQMAKRHFFIFPSSDCKKRITFQHGPRESPPEPILGVSSVAPHLLSSESLKPCVPTKKSATAVHGDGLLLLVALNGDQPERKLKVVAAPGRD
jgi:hypothetical protein